MKNHLFTSLAAATILDLVAGIVLNIAVVPLFAASASALVLLIAATDYAAPRTYDRQVCCAGRRESLPFAA